MTREDVLKMFPIKVEVTQEMIDKGKASLFSVFSCIGAQVLKSVFEDNDITWGTTHGTIHLGIGDFLHVTTRQGVNMMDIQQPMVVTLIQEL